MVDFAEAPHNGCGAVCFDKVDGLAVARDLFYFC